MAGIAAVGLAAGAFATPRLDPTVAGLKQTVQLLVLMETDGTGKVSKADFMKFMSNEFDRLDTNHNGVLDVSEVNQEQVHVHAGGSRR
jgi:hypothetical protein